MRSEGSLRIRLNSKYRNKDTREVSTWNEYVSGYGSETHPNKRTPGVLTRSTRRSPMTLEIFSCNPGEDSLECLRSNSLKDYNSSEKKSAPLHDIFRLWVHVETYGQRIRYLSDSHDNKTLPMMAENLEWIKSEELAGGSERTHIRSACKDQRNCVLESEAAGKDNREKEADRV